MAAARQDAHMHDLRRHSPAAERNGPPILAELKRLLPPEGVMLEIASGTGQHAAFLQDFEDDIGHRQNP